MRRARRRVTSMSDQLGNFGIGIEFACQKMKEAIEDKNMPATVKADLLKTLFKMHGALPSARTTPPMLGGGVFPGGEVVPFNEIPPEQLGVHADADRRDKEIEDGSPGDDVEE